jgi:hypothetical protein
MRKGGGINMINKIETEINNGRTMQLTQQQYDGKILLTTFNAKSGLVDHEEEISPGDLTMMVNWYRYQKSIGNKELVF